MALTALFTGVTGLQRNSLALDVSGNNIANLNTTGYKSQLMNFKDLLYQTLSSGSAPSGGLGGKNPLQVGFGVAVGSIGSEFTQASINPSGRSLDAAIQGSGFFVLSDSQSQVYTRAGAFSVDAAGYLVDPNTGMRVQRSGTVGETSATAPGFQTPGNSDIRIPFGAGLAGVPTTTVQLQGNLSSSLAVNDTKTAAIQIYDSLSGPQPLTLTFTKTGVGSFDVTAAVGGGGTATVSGGPITFDTAGNLVGPGTLTVDLTGISGAANQTITLNVGTPGSADGLTQFGGVSTATAVTQDGFGFGTLTDISFDTDGIVQGLFNNGRTIPLAQLAIAGFTNEGGLLRSGDNNFTSSPASGEAIIGPAGAGGRGTVVGGALEGSNVDIATEFSRLIIAQRGFQANARTITAANDTLQELANIIH
jgi:flagellar hook protein FlgE